MCYGTSGRRERGPFFSGVNCVLPITDFQIRLYSPTSTSKHIEVSLNFATRSGMIITFSNEEHHAKFFPFFDCSWMSRYPDENERLFIHGIFPMKVESIRIIKTNRKHTDLFSALFLFDYYFSGSLVGPENDLWIKQAMSNANLIDNLIENEVNNSHNLNNPKFLKFMFLDIFYTLEL